MYLVFLILAIVTEVVGTTSLKLALGLTRPLPLLGTVVSYACCFLFLSLALKHFDMGVVYAVWAGVGTALVATIGVLWFGEPFTASKVCSVLLIILGVIGLHFGKAM